MGAINGASTGAEPGRSVSAGVGDTRTGAGYTESVSYDDAGRLRFDVRPPGQPTATLVIASSLYAELQRNYRREVLLSRAAAAAGMAAVRFHYRGTGNSIVDVDVRLQSMIDDVLEVAGSIPGPVILVGTRVGALAVARARQRLDVPAVLWEPVVDGSRWVEEVIRACLAREVAQGVGVSADSIRSRWTSDGQVFVLGETVPSGIVDDVGGSDLVADLAGTAPVQLVQMARNEKVRPDLERAKAAVEEKGAHVQVLAIVGRQTWWVNEGGDLFRPVERDEATTALIAGVLDFARGTL